MRALAVVAALAVAGCGQDPVFFSAPAAGVTVQGSTADPGSPISVPFASIEVREVSLPTYAGDRDIFYEGLMGTLMPIAGAEWADLPPRAVTLDLVAVLGAVTGARVAAEPWPFEAFPEARVEIRATRMAAGADGAFRLSGQYYVADLRTDVDNPSDRTMRFEVAVPYDQEMGVASIADARSRAVRDLARQIAAQGM